MAITFEVVHKDIAGRIGKLRVNDKTVRTPALLPVVNPHLPLVTPREIQEMGVEALITNAYIFRRSTEYHDRALAEGLHGVLDFDGVVMTDSGSFQLSVYGEVEVSNRDTLEFQQAIKSDIVVPLDIPTPPDAGRERAARELAVTMERIREAQALFPDANLAAPVQGGIFTDLREEAGRAVRDLDFAFAPIGAVVPLMESYRYKDLVQVVLAAKRGLSPATAVHLFGAGHPSMFALAVAMGCDLFDSAAYALFAREGRYITPHGSLKLDELAELPCPLPGLPLDDRRRTPEVRGPGAAARPPQPARHSCGDRPHPAGDPGRDPLGTRRRAVPEPPAPARRLPGTSQPRCGTRTRRSCLQAPVLLPGLGDLPENGGAPVP